jgi:hypothetical protein
MASRPAHHDPLARPASASPEAFQSVSRIANEDVRLCPAWNLTDIKRSLSSPNRRAAPPAHCMVSEQQQAVCIDKLNDLVGRLQKENQGLKTRKFHEAI